MLKVQEAEREAKLLRNSLVNAEREIKTLREELPSVKSKASNRLNKQRREKDAKQSLYKSFDSA